MSFFFHDVESYQIYPDSKEHMNDLDYTSILLLILDRCLIDV